MRKVNNPNNPNNPTTLFIYNVVTVAHASKQQGQP